MNVVGKNLKKEKKNSRSLWDLCQGNSKFFGKIIPIPSVFKLEIMNKDHMTIMCVIIMRTSAVLITSHLNFSDSSPSSLRLIWRRRGDQLPYPSVQTDLPAEIKLWPSSRSPKRLLSLPVCYGYIRRREIKGSLHAVCAQMMWKCKSQDPLLRHNLKNRKTRFYRIKLLPCFHGDPRTSVEAAVQDNQPRLRYWSGVVMWHRWHSWKVPAILDKFVTTNRWFVVMSWDKANRWRTFVLPPIKKWDFYELS